MKKPIITKEKAFALAKRHGSPLYIYRKSIVKTRYSSLEKAILYPRKRIFYACKANANFEVMRFLRGLGASVECVSRGEVERALKTGFPRNRISYTCSNISREELKWVMGKKVSVHLDSLTQVAWWGQMNPGSSISLRVNRGFGTGAHTHIITGGPESKFGIYFTDLPKAKALAKQYRLKIVGLQQHIGSNILQIADFIRAMKLLLQSARGFKDLEFIDFGGGFGIPYQPNQTPLNIPRLGKEMANLFSRFCRSYGRDLELRIEPGRYLVAEAGALLTVVTDIKRTPGRTFIGIDSGMNHLIRPALYNAHHEIFNLSNPKAPRIKANIVGNICESGDLFAAKRSIPAPNIGSVLLFADTGAYGYAMSSEYNLRNKPREILLP